VADLFVSYASEDREIVAGLVPRFEAHGYTVWWDRALRVGDSFDRQIEKEIESARCVMVFWSPHSVGSDWVRAEAGEGLEKGCLVQVLLGELRPPLVFRQQQAFHYSEETHPDLAPLISAVEAAVKRSPPSEGVSQRLWLVADFENETGDDVFTGSLPWALEIGLDHLTDLFLYPRDALLSVADRNQAYLRSTLELAGSEGLEYVLGGEIGCSNGYYTLTLRLMDLRAGTEHVFSAEAVSRGGIMEALAALTEEALLFSGTVTGQTDPSMVRKRIAALDLDCVREDWLGGQAHGEVEMKDAIDNFRRAVEIDATFVPAWVGMALAFDNLGQGKEAREAIDRTLDHLQGLSERERHRTQAMYYLLHSENNEKALAHIQAVSKISPLEVSAINNEALFRCNLLDFEGAVTTLSRALDLAPDEPFYRVNLALYCMYAGQFERAISLSQSLVADGQDSLDTTIALACSLYALGEVERAHSAAARLPDSADYPHTGRAVLLADLQMAAGEMDTARATLDEVTGRKQDGNADHPISTALLMQAELALTEGRHDQAHRQISQIIESDDDVRTIAHAAILAADLQEQSLLESAAAGLGRKLDAQSKAYLMMIEGLLARVRRNYGEAERLIREAIGTNDLWMLHLVLAELYDSLDMTLEARLERDVCARRSGEGVTAWINRIPTCRYLAKVRTAAG
jgi:tetratricopeptide (TPR) repeat protein